MKNFDTKQFHKPIKEQSPAELFLSKLGLFAGVRIKLVKLSSFQESQIENGDFLEGILDQDVEIGKPIYLDNKIKNTSQITAVKEEGDKILFKTATSIYELVPPDIQSSSLKPNSKELIEIEKRINISLKNAQDVALENNEMKILFQNRISLQRQPRTIKNLEDILKLDKEIERHKVFVSTLIEFQILMNKLDKNYYRVNNTVSHENAHANKANSIGAIHDGYSVLVYKSKDGNGFTYQPIAHTKVPDNWFKNRQITADIKIGSAPEEYGNILSDIDEEQIDILRKELNLLNN